MSLRAEIVEAIDEVTPPAPHLERRVTAFVVAGTKGKNLVRPWRSRAPWTLPLRRPLAVVAAALVVALIGGLVIGGRLFLDTNVPTNVISPKDLRELESRQLHFPPVPSSGECPISPLTDISAHGAVPFMRGPGPVYSDPIGYGLQNTNWGAWSVLSLEIDTTTASGPLLIRARDLQSHSLVAFSLRPYQAVGEAGAGIPTGTAIGTDVFYGETQKTYPEVLLDLSRPYPGTAKGQWPIYKSWMGIPKAAAGCIGLQIDGAGGVSEILVLST